MKPKKLCLTKKDSCGIEYTIVQNFFENLAIFDFESICVQEGRFKHSDTTKWIGKLISILVSVSSNLVNGPIFSLQLWSSSSCYFFHWSSWEWALQSKAIMKTLFFDMETTIKLKLGSVLEKLTQRCNRREQGNLDDCGNETCTSTQFLHIQKKQLIDLQEHLERYSNVLPIFGFNSAKYDFNPIKSHLLPILVKERNIEPTVIKKRTSLSPSKSVIFSCWILWFFGGATSLDSFLKAYKTSETKGFLSYEKFDHPDKMQKTEFPAFDAFYSKLRSCNPLETECTDFVNLLKIELTTE